MAIFELRTYRPMPGKMDGWVRVMEEIIIPFQVSKGMVILGSFRGETDDLPEGQQSETALGEGAHPPA